MHKEKVSLTINLLENVFKCVPPTGLRQMLSIYAIIDFTFSSRAINGVIWFLLFSVSILRLFLVCSLNLLNFDQKRFEIFSQDLRFSRIEKVNCCHKILGLEPSRISLGAHSRSPKEGSERMNLRQPRSPCVLQFEIHLRKQESNQTRHCPL